MAESTKVQPQFILADEKVRLQAHAEEVAARMAENPTEAKRPGGMFLRADGTPVDAENREIKEEDLTADEKKAVAAQKRGTKETDAEAAATEAERVRLAAAAVKVQATADAANKKATDAAIEAERAKSRVSTAGRR